MDRGLNNLSIYCLKRVFFPHLLLFFVYDPKNSDIALTSVIMLLLLLLLSLLWLFPFLGVIENAGVFQFPFPSVIENAVCFQFPFPGVIENAMFFRARLKMPCFSSALSQV